MSTFLDSLSPTAPLWPGLFLGSPSLLLQPGAPPRLTQAEPKFLTLADVGKLQHLAPFLALAFAIPTTTCKSKQ